ncbi:MAG: GGDEF domain-containing protein [Bdellovibrionales bacterium]|nr:GGDEF domain-containing protein [Bdellovibrionales bacterium]
MKQWMSKLIEQLNYDVAPQDSSVKTELSEERATLIYILDTLNKHLLEIDHHPVRKVRNSLDEYSRLLLSSDASKLQKSLHRLREFFGRYRIDEYTYILKTFNDFRSIIWDFVEQISDALEDEEADQELQSHIDELRDAVEANSMEQLRTKSLSFIDSYSEYQTKRDTNKSRRLSTVKKSLNDVKKQLVEAHHNLMRDHLTSAFNRKSFDEKIHEYWTLARINPSPMTLLALDIDHFKKVNDTHGHAVGDFVLVETVKLLKQIFHREKDFVARIGGEEFTVILPEFDLSSAIKKAAETLDKVQESVFVHDDKEIRFTISIGIAEYEPKETVDSWMKRADQALYTSKNSGRNRFTIAPSSNLKSVA